MSFFNILAIAVGLGMDAFAVSVSSGCQLKQTRFGQLSRMAGAFGLFQGVMVIAGWLAGRAIAQFVYLVAPWIAFALLLIVAVHMIIEGIKGEVDKSCTQIDPTQGWTLIGLALATSIDAFAVGTSLSLLNISIWYPSVVIALVAAIMTIVGLKLGCRLGDLLGKRMEIVGGLILLYIAIHTLFTALT